MSSELVDLVHRARHREEAAWDELVEQFASLIAAIARSCRLGPSDAADVAQTTWLRLFESIERIREPERLPGWIATTARRECLRLLRMAARELPSDEVDRIEAPQSYADPGQELISAEARSTVRSAVRTLPVGHRHLMQVLLTSPPPAYSTVADSLDMPIGSIGPTRGRAIERLRRDPQILALAS